mmetsp:Transcript_20923/g.59686  ORF Transcript_20923/g.59686 Transcript_20923/m.59686 type:complete len:219 (+) Transcript_20923:289-945(+)
MVMMISFAVDPSCWSSPSSSRRVRIISKKRNDPGKISSSMKEQQSSRQPEKNEWHCCITRTMYSEEKASHPFFRKRPSKKTGAAGLVRLLPKERAGTNSACQARKTRILRTKLLDYRSKTGARGQHSRRIQREERNLRDDRGCNFSHLRSLPFSWLHDEHFFFLGVVAETSRHENRNNLATTSSVIYDANREGVSVVKHPNGMMRSTICWRHSFMIVI